MNKLKTAKTKLGNEIYLTGDEDAKTLIIGVFHGDEPQGKYLIEKYLEKDLADATEKTMGVCPLSPLLEIKDFGSPLEGGSEFSIPRRGQNYGRGGNLFIPCLNPDGLQLGQRTNANGVDLNRNFPTKNWELTEKNEFFGGEQPASEIETQFVIDIINAYQPETILTLHAPYKVVNYDGPAQDLAEQISEIINYPVEASIGYPTPGSFGTYAGIERQIKTLTLELDENCPVEELEMPVYNIFDTLL